MLDLLIPRGASPFHGFTRRVAPYSGLAEDVCPVKSILEVPAINTSGSKSVTKESSSALMAPDMRPTTVPQPMRAG